MTYRDFDSVPLPLQREIKSLWISSKSSDTGIMDKWIRRDFSEKQQLCLLFEKDNQQLLGSVEINADIPF